MKLWKGEKVVYAKDVPNSRVQDRGDLLVVGANVEALYPSLQDIEIANVCYNTIMKSNISLNNIKYRRALLYLAITMNRTDQRTSPLWIIPGGLAEVGSGLESLHHQRMKNIGTFPRWS